MSLKYEPASVPQHISLAFSHTLSRSQKSKRMCAIMLDTKGPEIRTGMLKDGKDIDLVAGQEFTLVNDWDYIGDATMVGQSYADLGKVLQVGSNILMDDGLISLTVKVP